MPMRLPASADMIIFRDEALDVLRRPRAFVLYMAAIFPAVNFSGKVENALPSLSSCGGRAAGWQSLEPTQLDANLSDQYHEVHTKNIQIMSI